MALDRRSRAQFDDAIFDDDVFDVETFTCLWCNDIVECHTDDDGEHYPYCSSACARRAEQDSNPDDVESYDQDFD